MIEDLRLCIFRALARTGRMPPLAELLAIAGGHRELADGLAQLAAARHLALEGGDVVLAHPFATRSFGFSVMSRDTLWWGGCAWDAFAIPHVVGTDVLVATRCPTCDRALAWVVDRTAPPPGAEVAHFVVPLAEMWNDVIHTCANQRLYCSDACTPLTEGTRLDLATLWRLAAHWYDGRLERGYQRRDSAAAKEYFRSVGLTGAFWGL
jgi:hypothetical protein